MTTKEKIEVMQAYEDGKQIECRQVGYEEWEDSKEPTWDWVMFDYRIKPEPKYRPYIDTAELIADWMERFGKYDTKVVMPPIWVKNGNDEKYHVTDYYHYSVGLSTCDETLIGLFHGYTYLDGSPCGKEASE